MLRRVECSRRLQVGVASGQALRMRSYDSSAVTTRTHARAHIITAPLAFTPLCPSSQAPKLLRYLEQEGAAPSPAAEFE